ncbi:Hypothetical protein, putative [Bodo saltans]|uniref:Uncharacterized protein n=1 Tax=Bodo saltans TaxID=75058 RepID=A0A0S4KMA7_BODSA|nr:Hypothetical protein, putative [Bodo saltans]|eukprot:CUI15519.1 Hypothetical protein, putative [Bodo saltans]
MAEKKRVTILVDATVTREDQNIFNFGAVQPQAAQPAGSGPEEEAPVTTYQRGRKSIVDGMNATDLLQLHRKSLADLGTNGNHSEVDPDRFAGVTLSRRHQVTRNEYEAAQDEQTTQQFSAFTFGSSE